jgi:transcriptional antiterminator
LTIQKEMLRYHYFFDKMQKIELQPLTPQQMLEAYMKRFKTTQPFTEEALITLVQMSRGIFRRYLKYITSTLEHWQAQSTPHEPITKEIVKEAVTPQRLAEDIDPELSELFPKQSDLKLQAIRLLLNLSESGLRRQDQLAEELNLDPSTVNRLLQKLELHRYITRKREGNDKIVSLTGTE